MLAILAKEICCQTKVDQVENVGIFVSNDDVFKLHIVMHEVHFMQHFDPLDLFSINTIKQLQKMFSVFFLNTQNSLLYYSLPITE